MAEAKVELVISAKDLASRTLRNIGATAGNAASELSSKFVTATAIVGTAFVGLGIKSLMAASDVEMALNKYTVMLGSLKEARKRVDELTAFAAKTPFELNDIIRADQMLEGFGIRSAKNLRIVGDAAAISGSNIGELSLILGQLKGSKELENIRQLVDRGVISFDQLREAGIKFAKDGSIVNSVEDTYDTVLKIIDKRFKGGMTTLSKTLPGLLSTLSDTINLGLAKIGQDTGLLDFVKGIVNETIKITEEIIPKITKFVLETKEQIQKGLTELAPIFEQLRSNMQPFFELLLSNQNVVKDAVVNFFALAAAITAVSIIVGVVTSPLTILVGVLAIVATGIALVQNNVFGLRDGFNGLTSSVQPLIAVVQEGLSTAFETVREAIASAWPEIQKAWMELQKAWQESGSLREILGILVGFVAGQAMEAFQSFAGTLSFVIKSISSVIGYASKLLTVLDGLAQFMVNVWQGDFESAANGVRRAFSGLSAVFSPIQGAIDNIIGSIGRLLGLLGNVGPAKSAALGGLKGVIPGFATGVENFRGGVALVGEKGPELVNLPRGSDVVTADKTREMLGASSRGGGRSTNVTINVQIPLFAGSEDEKRRVAEELFKALGDVAKSRGTNLDGLLGAL